MYFCELAHIVRNQRVAEDDGARRQPESPSEAVGRSAAPSATHVSHQQFGGECGVFTGVNARLTGRRWHDRRGRSGWRRSPGRFWVLKSNARIFLAANAEVLDVGSVSLPTAMGDTSSVLRADGIVAFLEVVGVILRQMRCRPADRLTSLSPMRSEAAVFPKSRFARKAVTLAASDAVRPDGSCFEPCKIFR